MKKENKEESGAYTALGAMCGGVLLPGLAFAMTASAPIAGVAFGIGLLAGGLGGNKLDKICKNDNANKIKGE